MKIAIIGTRGIPNRYGGFEQFAEIVSQYWVSKGHEVICYNPHDHFYNEPYYEGVKIVKKFSPENEIGAAANFIYDYFCLKNAVAEKCDILLELGYQSASLSYLFISKKNKMRVVTNMDGLEWKRDKWSPLIKKITRWAEKLAVKHSGALISDNQGIANYYKREFGIETDCIAYGCESVPKLSRSIYSDYLSSEILFDLVIARLEPENSIETILYGVIKSNCSVKLYIIGNKDTQYGKHLQEKFKDERIIFVGGIFDKKILDSLRQHCRYYYHGHTVGGTNPSLLEAMAAGSSIVAHGNEFNMTVLNEDAYFFDKSKDIELLRDDASISYEKFFKFVDNNKQKIDEIYSWDLIGDSYLDVFERVMKECE